MTNSRRHSSVKKTKKRCKSLPANKKNANLQNNYNQQAKMKQCKKGVK